MMTASILAAADATSKLNPTLFLTVFAVYIAIMIGMSIMISKKQTSGEDFLLGNRSVPFFLILGTTVATLVGTGSSMGAVGAGYETGWKGAFFGLGGAIGMILMAYIFAGVRKYNFMTMSEEISFYYGANRTIKNLIGLITYIASIGWLGAHIMGGAKYLSWVAGIDVFYCKLIIAAAFSVYVIVGGYMAVVWTDTIQAVILFFGFILMGVLAVGKMGGMSALTEVATTQGEIFFNKPLLPAISLAFGIAVSALSVPSFRQRVYSGDSVENIKKSFLYTGILYLFFSIFPAIIGMAAFKLDPGLSDADHAFTFLASDVLPLAIGIVVLVAGLSATMSSASSDAIAGVSILLRDIYNLIFGKLPGKDESVKLSRIGLVITTIIALSFTLMSTGVMGYIQDMIAIVFSGMFACAILGKFWKRATWQGGVAALLGGSGVAISFKFNDSWMSYWGNATIPAVSIALLAGVVVSLATPKRTITDEEALDILEEERKQMEMHDEVEALPEEVVEA
ncbi:MAG: sodium:solute symporter family protein [Lentisphaerales bacterium]|nr:sodium:solute symporter family protein [Lentisphaerales bacterium]